MERAAAVIPTRGNSCRRRRSGDPAHRHADFIALAENLLPTGLPGRYTCRTIAPSALRTLHLVGDRPGECEVPDRKAGSLGQYAGSGIDIEDRESISSVIDVTEKNAASWIDLA